MMENLELPKHVEAERFPDTERGRRLEKPAKGAATQ
jgi:hypothetical protein